MLNDLTTGLTQSEARMMLEKMWNVTDYASYQAASDRLSRYEESKKYIAVAKNPEATGDLAESFAAAFAMYKRQGLIETDAVPSMTAWDLCRQIALARLAFYSEILSHDEAMRVVTDTAKLLKLSYSSWKGLSVGWQFGSLMRGGFSEDAARLLQADMHELLTLPDSPWVQMPFTMPLGF